MGLSRTFQGKASGSSLSARDEAVCRLVTCPQMEFTKVSRPPTCRRKLGGRLFIDREVLPCGVRTCGPKQVYPSTKIPNALGEGRPIVVQEAANKSGRRGGQPVMQRPSASVFSFRKPLWLEYLLRPEYSECKPQRPRPFSGGSSVGQGLLHAKEKRNLLAEYFLDILQDARPP